MKICLFNVTSTMDRLGSAEVGGVEAYGFGLAAALRERGHDVELWGGRPKEALSYPATGVEIRLFEYLETRRVPDLGTRFRRLAQRLHFAWHTRHEFCGRHFDAVLIFKPYDFVTAWLWRRWGVRSRVVAGIHGPEFYALDRFFCPAVDALYAVSPSTAREVEKHYRVKCPVLPNFLDGRRYAFMERGEPRERLIVSAGRLVGWKGMAVLIRAFARVKREIPEACLAILGDGPERGSLMELADQLGVGGSVSLPGLADPGRLADYHRRAWVYVQPSIGYESFSISTLEALARGVAVIVSDRVGLAEWFGAENSLETCPHGNEEALACGLTGILTGSWEAHCARARRLRTVVERRFLVECVIPQIEALCENRSLQSSV
ncbi:MAG: glycosyltransferase family 4 protein [Verrucomicrobiae bacterium]|nr:glycosyltransferase family 4 protein [Verrucomicrobiae bacterium]